MRHGAFLLLVRLYSIENKEQEVGKIKKKKKRGKEIFPYERCIKEKER